MLIPTPIPQSPSLGVDVERADLTKARLSWPEPGEAGEESGLGCNRAYFDMRGVGWLQVRDMLSVEAELLRRVLGAPDPSDELAAVEEEIDEDLDAGGEHPLWGLDLAVASATLALSAAGCVTFASCNGGGIDGSHHLEAYPLVAFYMRPRIAGVIHMSATAAGVGLHTHGDGFVHVYGDRATDVYVFAEHLYASRATIRVANRANPMRKRSRRANRDVLI